MAIETSRHHVQRHYFALLIARSDANGRRGITRCALSRDRVARAGFARKPPILGPTTESHDVQDDGVYPMTEPRDLALESRLDRFHVGGRRCKGENLHYLDLHYSDQNLGTHVATHTAYWRSERRVDGPNSGAALAAGEATTPRLQGPPPEFLPLQRPARVPSLPFGCGGRRHRGQRPPAAVREHPWWRSPARWTG